MNRRLELEELVPLVGTPFQVVYGPAGEALELILTAAQTAATTVGRSFELFFFSEGVRYLPQGNFLFRHPVLGEAAIFIVPLGTERDGTRYQAIFHYLD